MADFEVKSKQSFSPRTVNRSSWKIDRIVKHSMLETSYCSCISGIPCIGTCLGIISLLRCATCCNGVIYHKYSTTWGKLQQIFPNYIKIRIEAIIK